ncbi:MAG: radical SAM protein [Elusimicrobia bacterium]|nr:radical SAM protein [Elusimicrobiota bacterium]
MPPTTHAIEFLTLGETQGGYSLVLSPLATLGFDPLGRPQGLYEGGLYTARGLDGRCLEKKWVWEGDSDARRHIRELTDPERSALRARFGTLLAQARLALPELAGRKALRRMDRGRELAPDIEAASRTLARLAEGLEKSWDQDPAHFARVWRPLGILPPDQYLALVIQVVEGCAWNQCAFCDFYAGRPFRVRSAEEILRHTDEAETFFGPALAGRCSIFLGDANAFQAPPDLLISTAEKLAARFPRLAAPQRDGIGGLYGFAEAARLAAWTPADLRALAKTGFRRAYLGVETGCDDLRRWLQKPGTSDTVIEAAAKLKGAGIDLGLIVLLGAGGVENARRHVEGTLSLLKRSPLGPGDLVYFSPLIVEEGSPYGRAAADRGWTPMGESALGAQRKEMEAALPPRGERRALYDIREFLY